MLPQTPRLTLVRTAIIAAAVAAVGACLLTNQYLSAHDSHGRSHAPLASRLLKNPLPPASRDWKLAQPLYERACASCHAADGRAMIPAAAEMTVRPTDLSNYLMDSMSDGEIYWVVTFGIAGNHPRFNQELTEVERWQLVLYVRELRSREKSREREQLGNYDWKLPPGFPFPNVPRDNPMTSEKVELGRYLFYDKRLSLNQKQSCATCHQQARAFTDGRARGLGSTGQVHPRSPMSLVNVAYVPALTWANPKLTHLEQQILVPMFGEDPVELGMAGQEDVLFARLKAEPVYQRLFSAAFPRERDPFSLAGVVRALASFERTILSGDSPYDRFRRGDDPRAISDSARRGEALFFGERADCFHCHGGFNFTSSEDHFEKGSSELQFQNNGLYNLKGPVSYPAPNTGLYVFTGRSSDVGKFRAPTLRNIAVTAPYMHDGSLKTLDAVIDHYGAGGRGADNPNKSPFVHGFKLSDEEREDLIAFLQSLTDETLLRDPALSNPWTKESPKPVRSTAIKYTIKGEVVQVYPEEGIIELSHETVSGLMAAVKAPDTRQFIVPRKEEIASLQPGQSISATVRRQNRDYVLEDIRRR